MSESSILNLDKRDPFADIDAGELGTIKGHKEGYVRTYYELAEIICVEWFRRAL